MTRVLRIWVQQFCWKISFGRSGCKWEDNNRIGLPNTSVGLGRNPAFQQRASTVCQIMVLQWCHGSSKQDEEHVFVWFGSRERSWCVRVRNGRRVQVVWVQRLRQVGKWPAPNGSEGNNNNNNHHQLFILLIKIHWCRTCRYIISH
jgi:hypothetical protein